MAAKSGRFGGALSSAERQNSILQCACAGKPERGDRDVEPAILLKIEALSGCYDTVIGWLVKPAGPELMRLVRM
ncbi:MAG: hypothetical protein WA709_29145 [Stellaceae bacterium]